MGIIRKLSGKIVFFKRKCLIGSRCKFNIPLDDEFTFKTRGSRKVGRSIIIHEFFSLIIFMIPLYLHFLMFLSFFFFFLGTSDSTG